MNVVSKLNNLAERIAAPKMDVVCNECGKKFKANPKNFDIQCPKCHGSDVEPAY